MNHFAKNIITKGWLGITALYKGFVLPFFKYEIKRKRGGGGGYAVSSGYREENLVKDLTNVREEDIDYIKVWVEWDKNVHKYDKKIYVELVTKKIQATLLEKHNFSNIKIDVELI